MSECKSKHQKLHIDFRVCDIYFYILESNFPDKIIKERLPCYLFRIFVQPICDDWYVFIHPLDIAGYFLNCLLKSTFTWTQISTLTFLEGRNLKQSRFWRLYDTGQLAEIKDDQTMNKYYEILKKKHIANGCK